MNSSKMETFNDGTCSFRKIDDDGNAGEEKENLRFGERIVGDKRYYEAMTNKVQIDRIIRVPHRPWLTTEYLAVIAGEVYEINRTKFISKTMPVTDEIYLRLTRQRRIADGVV